jgi:hypothetical protein
VSRELQAALEKLLHSDAGQVPGSQFTQAQKRAIEEFRVRTGAVSAQRSGRGVTYRVTNRTIVEQHSRDASPLSPDEIGHDIPNRAANIGRSRSSKRGSYTHAVYYLLLKAPSTSLWHTDDGAALDVGVVTEEQGAAVIAIGGESDQSWRTEGELWLVENQALFDRLDWLPVSEAVTVAWYSGHLRNNLIDWLAERPRAAHIHLFPDYDGVGLQNYLRIRQRLGQGVSFWMMPDWEERLRRFGNNKLWQDTADEFHAAVAGLQSFLAEEPDLAHLVQVIQMQGLALEQESIWL